MSATLLLHPAKFDWESVAQARASGVERLLELHYAEIAHYPDIPLDIDWDAYSALEKVGRLCVFTARIDGVLVGYSVHVVGPNMHYKGSIQAMQDVLFVDPVHRRGSVGLRLIRFSDRRLKELGVQVSLQHSKAKKEISIGQLLERAGYELVDTVHAKRLDRG